MSVEARGEKTGIDAFASAPHLTDLGNAARLVARHGKDLRHVAAEDAWYIWDQPTGVWRKDDSGEIVRRASETILAAHHAAVEEQDEDIRKKLLKHFFKSEDEPPLRRMVSLARSAPGVATRPSDFDRDPYLFCAGNGLIDLRRGTIRPHEREALCTRRTAVCFDPFADCPRWMSFLDEVFLGDRDLIAFVRTALGYALTGDTREHAMFFPFGLGSNGKSVFLETIRHVMGTYAATADASTFLLSKEDDGRPRNDIARLAGVRLVTAVETEEGARLAESLVKSLTGGDVITARFLFKEHFEFRPQFKIWLATNHKPSIRGTDDGIWRRIHLVLFGAKFEGERIDRDLPAKLRDEAPGILRWLIEACTEWQEKGLTTAKTVRQATIDYREDQDQLGAFLRECCTTGPLWTVTTSDLYRAFVAHAERTGERPWTQKTLALRLQERGFAPDRSGRARSWTGLGLSQIPT